MEIFGKVYKEYCVLLYMKIEELRAIPRSVLEKAMREQREAEERQIDDYYRDLGEEIDLHPIGRPRRHYGGVSRDYSRLPK